MSMDAFSRILGDVEADRTKLEMWPGNIDLCDPNDKVPPVFSAQLDDWMTFRQKWQWDNRGKIASEEGLSEFRTWHAKKYVHQGEMQYVSGPIFEENIKQTWELQPTLWESSSDESFAAYVQAVRNRLASHNFVEVFELAEDPRQQDQRTTWIEYLNFAYCALDVHVVIKKAWEPQYRKAWEELQSFYESLSSVAAIETSDQKLKTARQEIKKFFLSY